MSTNNRPPEQGGHNWVAGEGQEVCSFGCGSYSDEEQSWIPTTEPHGICPLNPTSKQFEYDLLRSRTSIPLAEGGHLWGRHSSGIRCGLCATTVPLDRQHHAARPLPDGICVNNNRRFTMEHLRDAANER